jgi:hypothetical protein
MTGKSRMPDPVECYSGAEYAEEPRRFLWEGEWRMVHRIVSRGRLPEGKQFAVEDGLGEPYLLTYWTESGQWTIRPGR